MVHFVAGVTIRGRIRQNRGIDGTLCNDILTVLFCPLCAIIQEAHELRGEELSSLEMARE